MLNENRKSLNSVYSDNVLTLSESKHGYDNIPHAAVMYTHIRAPPLGHVLPH